ncbi:SusC/RagA family TonB-linked outer membrane protein [Nostoc ellipsosporum NOK]|nr:SusC/RagA family TonB-linked outer membrane protein [Nostoc ellipsosporum NOK]
MKKRTAFVFRLLLAAATSLTMEGVAEAQSIIVTGTVRESNGTPVQGATVRERYSSNNRTLTTVSGSYSIPVTSDTSSLVFSYVGMETVVERVRTRRVIDVTMTVKLGDLEDIVIIGYNSTKRKDLTASVSSISKDALSDRTLFSLADAMKGKAAGVQIIQNDGTPGSENTIRIRGASSISASSAPLFVVDGVLQDDINTLNPGDIESVEILKDASGTAMYGARGANGVILVTTKMGKAGKTRVDIYSNVAFQRPGKMYDLMNSSEYARARYLASSYVYSPPSATNPNIPATTQGGLTYFRDTPLGTPGGFWGVALDATYHDWEKYNSPDSVNTDWQGAMFQNSMVQEYRVGITGGSKDTKFSFLGGYLDQGGLVIFSNYKRYNGRFNLQQKLSKVVTLTSNIAASRTMTDGYIAGSFNGGISSNAVVASMLAKPPVNPLTQTDVEDNEDVDGYISNNPYTLAKYVTNTRQTSDWITRMAIDWNITNNFSFRISGNYTTIGTNNDAYYPKFTSAGSRFNGRAVLSRSTSNRFMNENLLYYRGRIGRDHQFNGTAGAIFETSKVNQITAENQNYDVEVLGVYGLQNGTVPIIPTYNITKWSMASFLARGEYGYKGRYLFTVTFRADGSSRFSRTNKWGYFPSGAVAWRISDENFLRNSKTVSNLKLRATIGQSGNTAIPSYLTLSTIGTYFSPMNGNTPNYGVVVERPENLSLKWETTTQTNLGLDLGLFEDKISITLEGYLKRTKDLLIQKVTPGYTGFRSTWTNLGSIQNSGVEMNIAAVIIRKKYFSWLADANIGVNRSKAIEIGAELGIDPGVVSGVGTSAIIRNGQPIGQWYGYKTDGIYQTREEILSSGLTSINGQPVADVRPGTRRFIDQNGDGIINADDRVILGLGQPLFTGGFTNSIGYKGVNLNMVIQYSYGNKVYNANRVTLEQGRNPTNMSAVLADSWRPPLYDMNTGAQVEAGNPNNRYRMPGGPGELLMLSDWIEDASYIRLADVTLSYTITGKPLRRIGATSLGLFVSGKNLLIATNYSGYDPEVNTRQGGFGDLMPSLDFSSYPRSKVYSVGLKLQF